MTINQKVKETFEGYVHDPEFTAMRTRYRGLVRSYNVLIDKAAGKAKKKVKKSGNTGTDTTDSEGTGT